MAAGRACPGESECLQPGGAWWRLVEINKALAEVSESGELKKAYAEASHGVLDRIAHRIAAMPASNSTTAVHGAPAAAANMMPDA